MITLEEIKEKQEELNKMIEEYESQKEVVKDDLMSTWVKNWKPENGDWYYYIDIYNDVGFNINGNEYDEKLIKFNRVFQTEELAKKWIEIDTYLREKSFEPDWNDDNQKKWSFFYGCISRTFGFTNMYSNNHFAPFYFEREEIKDEILEKYTTEELEFYFNIGE